MIETIKYLAGIEVLFIFVNLVLSIFIHNNIKKIANNFLSLLALGIAYEMIVNNINHIVYIIFFIISIFFVVVDLANVFNFNHKS